MNTKTKERQNGERAPLMKNIEVVFDWNSVNCNPSLQTWLATHPDYTIDLSGASTTPAKQTKSTVSRSTPSATPGPSSGTSTPKPAQSATATVVAKNSTPAAPKWVHSLFTFNLTLSLLGYSWLMMISSDWNRVRFRRRQHQRRPLPLLRLLIRPFQYARGTVSNHFAITEGYCNWSSSPFFRSTNVLLPSSDWPSLSKLISWLDGHPDANVHASGVAVALVSWSLISSSSSHL